MREWVSVMSDPRARLKAIVDSKTDEAIYRTYAERAALLATAYAEPGSAVAEAYRIDAQFYLVAATCLRDHARDLSATDHNAEGGRQ